MAYNPNSPLNSYADTADYVNSLPEQEAVKFLEDQGYSSDNWWSELESAAQNAWYDITGQEDKTSYYQAQVAREDALIARQEEREDTAMQRQAADMEAAGLSKYGMSGSSGASSSAGGSSNVHSGSDVRIGAILDLAKSMAEISNVQASTQKMNAEAAATTAGVERDDNYYQLAVVKQGAELVQMELENELTKQMTNESVQRVTASIQEQAREEAVHVYKLISMNVQNQLDYKDLNTYDERHEAEMAIKRTSAYLNQQYATTSVKQREYIDKQIEQAAQNILESVERVEKLDEETRLLVLDYAKAELNMEIMQYDLGYAQEHYLPYGSSGGILGSIVPLAQDITGNYIQPILNGIGQGLTFPFRFIYNAFKH